MKLSQLLEAAGPAGWKKNYEARIEIMPSYTHAMKNVYDMDGGQRKFAYKAAKEKFEKMKEDHPTHFLFKTVDEAKEYLKTMEYPNWPMFIENNKGKEVKVRGDKVDVSGYKTPDLDDITIEDIGNGKFMVSVDVQSGHLITVIRDIARNALADKKAIFNKNGKKIIRTYNDYGYATFKSNSVIINATKKEVEKYVAKAKNTELSNLKYKKEWEEDKAKEPERKKKAAEQRIKERKSRLESLREKYGNIANLVTAKTTMSYPEDEGYWAVFLKDNRSTYSKFSQYSSTMKKSKAIEEQEKLTKRLADILDSKIPAIKWTIDHLGKYFSLYWILNIKYENEKVKYDYNMVLNGGTEKELPYPIEAKTITLCDFAHLESFKNLPESMKVLQLEGCKSLKSFRGIDKHIKELEKINIYGTPVQSGLLDLLKIKGLNGISYTTIPVKTQKALEIVIKYLGQGPQGIVKAQRELIENDLEDYA